MPTQLLEPPSHPAGARYMKKRGGDAIFSNAKKIAEIAPVSDSRIRARDA